MARVFERLTGYRRGWTKKDRRPLTEWAGEFVTLPPSYSVPGKFDINYRLPLKEVFLGIQNPLVHRIRFRKPPRFGGSLISDIAIPYLMCEASGPALWYWPTDEAGKDHMKEKAWPLWKSIKPFMQLMPRNRHDRTITEVHFGPFFLKCLGANLTNAQGKGGQYLFLEETWMPVWQELYGQIEARTGDFREVGNYKIVDISQAGTKGDVEDRNWQEGHRAVWGYLAKDGKYYPLEFGGKREDGTRWGLVWNDDAMKDGQWNRSRAIETARYVCKYTGQEWAEGAATRNEWNKKGAYIVTNPDAPRDIVSYSVNGLLNYSFPDLVNLKISALEMASRGDMNLRKEYRQKYECLPWEELNLTIEIDTKASAYKYADYANGEVWEGEIRRTMMVDRQHGRAGDIPHRWVEIRAWRHDGSSRQLWCGRLNTKEACREMQHKFKVKDRSVWQDSAYEQDLVFKECIEYGWMAVRGSPTHNATWTHEEKNAKGEDVKVRKPFSPIQLAGAAGQQTAYMLYNPDYISDILANLLAGRGVPHEHPSDVNPVYLEHIKAKHKVEKRPGVYTWEKITDHADDHLFDCSKQGVLFAVVMKLLSMPKIAEQKAA